MGAPRKKATVERRFRAMPHVRRGEEHPIMLDVVETGKDLETAVKDLEEAVKRNKFGVLHVHDLQKTLKEKGVDFPNACRILEVCNPQRAVQVLAGNMP
jgi:uncharacterized protein (DUF302 family)